MGLGESIRINRQKALMTQEEFSKEIKVALSTVNRWEKDKARPNLSAMKSIKSFCEERNLPFDQIEKEWLFFNSNEE